MRWIRGHLIHIGFAKAGSTALQAWFSAQPQLVHASNGVGGVYTAEELASQVSDAQSNGAVWVVTSSEYFVAPAGSDEDPDDPADGGTLDARRRGVCHRLQITFGDAMILIVTRGFRAMMASGYSQTIREGATWTIDELLSLASRLHELQPVHYYDYDATVRLYADAFGEENVIVLPYELLRDDPRAFIGRLEQRLGLQPSVHLPPWVNESLSGPELYWYPRLTRLLTSLARRLGPLGPAIFAGYRRRIGSPRLGRLLNALSTMAPSRTVRPEREIPSEFAELWRGRASSLAVNPDYEPYASDYLNDRPASAAIERRLES